LYIPLNRKQNGWWSKEVYFFLNVGVHISEISQAEFWEVRQGFKGAVSDPSFPWLTIPWEFIPISFERDAAITVHFQFICCVHITPANVQHVHIHLLWYVTCIFISDSSICSAENLCYHIEISKEVGDILQLIFILDTSYVHVAAYIFSLH
jgi:hypothetical protein